MNYLDYELNKFYEREEIEEKMNELGFESEDEYIDYLADLEADAAIVHYELKKEK